MLAGAGVQVPMSDLFGPGGRQLLAAAPLAVESRSRIDSLLRVITALDFEIDLYAKLVGRAAARRSRLRRDPADPRRRADCWARCSSPRSATSPASHRPSQLASWAGLTPKHHESDTTVHRGRITKQGSRLVRWAAVEAVQRVPGHTRLGQTRDRIGERRGRNIGVVAAARELITLVFYGLRDHHIRCLPARTPATGAA